MKKLKLKWHIRVSVDNIVDEFWVKAITQEEAKEKASRLFAEKHKVNSQEWKCIGYEYY